MHPRAGAFPAHPEPLGIPFNATTSAEPHGPMRPVSANAPTLRSEVLGLGLRRDRGALRFRDAATGEDLLSHEEAVATREATEAKVAELEALLESMRN